MSRRSVISYQLSTCSVAPCGRRRRVAPPAFSLAELMIAIAILGIGLLVVASMFPIAWGKARDLSQHTTTVAVAETAEMTVKLVTRVDSAAECRNFTSFAGDYVVETRSSYPTPTPLSSFLNGGSPSDTKVHPLTLENVLVVAPSGGSSPIITDQTWLLMDPDAADPADQYRITPGDDPTNPSDLRPDPNLAVPCPGQDTVEWYNVPQVLLHQRVFPAVDPYPNALIPPHPGIDQWNARLETRRYCWAVFHRLNEVIEHPLPPNPPGDSGEQARFRKERRAAARTPRVFTMYYVILTRTQGQRFARQDEVQLAAGAITALNHTTAIPADVMFPSPWLVPITTPDPQVASRQLNYRVATSGNPDVVPRGVPTEVLVEVAAATDDDFRDFFAPGAWFIDSVNGEFYRVVKARYVDTGFSDNRFPGASGDPAAVLTLDREIFVEDLIDPQISPNPPFKQIPGAGPVDARRVWVFPPAIERLAQDEWAVQGPSPVVAIDVRSMVIPPR